MQQFCQKIGENVGFDLKLFTVFLQSTHCVQWTSHHHRVLDERRENRGARTLCAHTPLVATAGAIQTITARFRAFY